MNELQLHVIDKHPDTMPDQVDIENGLLAYGDFKSLYKGIVFVKQRKGIKRWMLKLQKEIESLRIIDKQGNKGIVFFTEKGYRLSTSPNYKKG